MKTRRTGSCEGRGRVKMCQENAYEQLASTIFLEIFKVEGVHRKVGPTSYFQLAGGTYFPCHTNQSHHRHQVRAHIQTIAQFQSSPPSLETL